MPRASTACLLPDVRELLQRSAAVPRGLALLHRAPIESIAVTLGVHPNAVERVRVALASPEQRALAIDEFARAVERTSRRPKADRGDPPPVYAG